MPLARCPKCGATFPNTLRECPGCGYSPFVRPQQPAAPQGGAQPQKPEAAPQDIPPRPFPPQPESAQPQAEAAPDGVPQADAQPEAGAPQAVPPQPFPPRPAPPRSEPKAAAPAGAEKRSPGVLRILLPVAAAVLLIVLAVIFLPPRKSPPVQPDPEPVFCADGAHEWREATCTEPKTCAVCGKTEGEALGHDFVGNVCTRCGAFEKMFTFSDLGCKRRGDDVVFTGVVRNYSGLAAKKIELRLELFDADKQLVTSDTVYILEEDPVQPEQSAQWRFTYNDTGVTWKYWRVSVTNFILG